MTTRVSRSADGSTPSTTTVDAPAMTSTSHPAIDLPRFGERIRTDRIRTPRIAPDHDRFVAWNRVLKAEAPGRESAFVDLDAIDHNLKRVGARLGAGIDLRLVAKSLPCLDLLEYMMLTAGTNRIMAFAEGMVRELLLRFGDRVDILLGRPAAIGALERTFKRLDEHDENNPACRVRWLVDTEARLGEYAAFAAQRGETVDVALEIDVGLRRGGARDERELIAMLRVIDASRHLRFAGLMGYDGHVPFASGETTPDVELERVQRRYDRFVGAGREAFPALFDGRQVFNGGGSRTYHEYGDGVETPVNDVAVGSALFYPSNFHDLDDRELRGASFFGTPILKRTDPAETPFDDTFLPGIARENQNVEVAFYMTTGDFPGTRIHPDVLTQNLDPSRPERPPRLVNMLPNQGRWWGSRDLPLEVGDFIFYQPWEGDAIRWLNRLDVFRGAELIDQWETFQPGIPR